MERGVQERLAEGVDAGDVGLRRALLHAGADEGAGDVHAAAGADEAARLERGKPAIGEQQDVGRLAAGEALRDGVRRGPHGGGADRR